MRSELGALWRRLSARQLAASALGVAFLVGLVVWFWPGATQPVRAAVSQVKDQLGLRLVEGHAERLARAAAEAGVDPYLLAGIMFSESRGRSGQVSGAGARGLMQLSMAAAGDSAKRLGLPAPTPEAVLNDDDLNVRLAASHLRWLLDHAGEWDLEMVLVSYNAGRTKLKRWIDRHGGYAGWRAQEEAAEDGGTGALHYALQTLEVAEALRQRGTIAPASED